MTKDICGALETSSGEPCQFSPGASCPYHDPDADPPDAGRPSKFDGVKDDLLDAAGSFLNHKQVANRGGIDRSTLYRYLNDHEEFCDRFKRARARAANDLVDRALDPNDEIDVQFARFLLERSFKFIKTERREVDMNASHSFDAQEHVTAEFVTYDDGDT